MVGGWAGMRGAVSLAAALALPSDFPARDLLLFLTFGVIFATLVLQGLTLPGRDPLVGRARRRLGGRGGAARPPARDRGGARAPRRAGGRGVDPRRHRRAHARLYEYRTRRLGARAGETEDEDGGGYEDRSRKYQKMVRSVLDAQRRAVVELRNEGEISNDVMHRIERELDLEDERLEI